MKSGRPCKTYKACRFLQTEADMNLKRMLFTAFSIIIVVPITLLALFMTGILTTQAEMLRSRFGIDIRHLGPSSRTLIFYILIFLFVIIVITAVILSFWLYRSISYPIVSLTKAVKSIRDGNLDFELKPEGDVEEIRDLCESFEQMRIRLLQANEVKMEFDRQNRELISNISHDLRTPLTAVRGYCEGIMDGVADTPEKMDRYIRTIYNKTNEMDRLINELSFYSRITTNRIPYAFDKVPVRQFFADAAEEIGDEMRSKGIDFTCENDVPEDVTVIADTEQLTRVLHNIISNAVKYTDKEEKRIDMRASVLGDEVQVYVTDNGKGIAAKDLANVFDRFYRADSSRSFSEGGSGIGLSIVKKIVEDHGGRVWVSSKEGEGTTMAFALRKYEEN